MHEAGFDRDNDVEDQIAAHGVLPRKVEEAILDPHQIPDIAYPTPTERHYAITGTTETARVLFVMFTTR